MSDKPESVPQAFPNHFGYGMTLRDYFAGQALAGHLSHPELPTLLSLDHENTAQLCYSLADAMLREREK